MSDNIVSKVTEMNSAVNLTGGLLSSSKIIEMIEIERKALLDPSMNSESIKPMSKSCGLKYVSLIETNSGTVKRKREGTSEERITIAGKKENCSVRVQCSNDCGLKREVVEENIDVPYDNWIGCNACYKWYCPKIRCLARFKKHHNICLRQCAIINPE